jgi:tRNA threonylcarbamoyladenosine biosynthesis protein TsaE
VKITTHSSHETEEIGRKLGALLEKNAFVALFGELGGGKTCLTRGIVASVSPESAHLVASPTFAIMNEYPGAIPVYHFDFYRLASGYEILELGFDDYFQGDGICIAEWSERLGDMLPEDHLSVTFEQGSGDSRRITFTAGNTHSLALIDKLELLHNSEEFL